MERKTALEAIQSNVKNGNLIKHMLAVEAVMKALAKKMDGDENEWAMAGLLHDIDVELTEGDLKVHGKPGAEMAGKLGASDEITQAILCHNDAHGVLPETPMERALFCADPVTGLITTAALVRPDKKLSGVTVDSLKKRFKEKRFAAGVNRDQLAACSEIGLQLDEFLAIALAAMQGVSGDLGL